MGIIDVIRKVGQYSSVSVVNGAFQFLFITYFARNLDLDQMGMVGLLLAFSYLTVPLITFGTLDLVGLNVVELSKVNFTKFLNEIKNFYFFTLILNSIFCVIIASYIDVTSWFVLVLLTFSVVRAIISLSDKIYIMRSDFRRFSREKIRTGLLTLLFGLTFFEISHTWLSYFAAIIVAESISVLFRFWGFRRYVNIELEIRDFRIYLIYGLPFVLNIGGAWILNQSDKLLIERRFGLDVLAGYTVAYQIGILIRTISNGITSSIIPGVYEGYKLRKVSETQRTYLKIVVLFSLIILCCIGLFLEFGYERIYGDRYLSYKSIVLFIALAYTLESFYRVYDSYIVYRRKNYAKTVILYLSALIGVACMFIFSNLIGVLGPALGVTIAYAVLLVLSRWYSMILKKV